MSHTVDAHVTLRRDACVVPIYTAHTARHCKTLQDTATRCSMCDTTLAYQMWCTYIYSTHCNTLQHAVVCVTRLLHIRCIIPIYTAHIATHCNILQHPAIFCSICDTTLAYQMPTHAHCNTLRQTTTKCPLQHTATHCNTLQHTATHCNTLQHTATHCNTLQHTATHRCVYLHLRCPHRSAGVKCDTL